MGKTKLHWILIVILVATTIIAIRLAYSYYNQLTDAKLSNTDKQFQLAICEKYNVFVSAVKEIGSRPYDIDNYDCYDHSVDLRKMLSDNNIQSSIMIKEGRDHAWVAVWIEATTGKFIGMGTEYVLEEIRNNNSICNCIKNNENTN